MSGTFFFVKALLTLAAISLGARLIAEEAKTKVLDLNQMDMEQVEDNWDSSRPATLINPDSNLKIRDIVEPTSDYTYASFGKPDPFTMPSSLFAPPPSESTITETGDSIPGAAPGSKEITVTSPLQAYPLSALIVRGVWQTAEGEFRAVIQTPKKEGIVIKNGDPISSGKVLSIEKDSIMVRLYKLRKDGVREYDDSRMSFGTGPVVSKATIKLEPGKDAQFPGMEEPAEGASEPKGSEAPAAPRTGGVPPPGFINPDLKKPTGGAAAPGAPASTLPDGKAANAPAGAAAPAAKPELGWPYNTGGAPAAPAPTSGRPGANIK